MEKQRPATGSRSGITLLLVDLDNTLFPTSAIPAHVVQPAIDALWAANTGSIAVEPELLQRAVNALWRIPFDEVVQEYSLPAPHVAAWSQAALHLEVTEPLQPYPDVAALAQMAIRRILVTTGHERFQRSKIAALGVAAMFESIHIDALDKPHERKGKAMIFREILATHHLKPTEVAVVGDGRAEIIAGQSLGLTTVQVLRDGVVRIDEATFHVRDFVEMSRVLRATTA